MTSGMLPAYRTTIYPSFAWGSLRIVRKRLKMIRRVRYTLTPCRRMHKSSPGKNGCARKPRMGRGFDFFTPLHETSPFYVNQKLNSLAPLYPEDAVGGCHVKDNYVQIWTIPALPTVSQRCGAKTEGISNSSRDWRCTVYWFRCLTVLDMSGKRRASNELVSFSSKWHC